jgi:hypothetical protein
VFDADTTAFLETGCALLVATVLPDGEPFAARAWALTVVDAARGEVRILLDAEDTEAIALVGAGAPVACTGASVVDLRSVQLKGRGTGVEAATAADLDRAGEYTEALFADIEATDGYARSLLERLLPRGYVPCTVVVEELFDQTPGPGAGKPMARP